MSVPVWHFSEDFLPDSWVSESLRTKQRFGMRKGAKTSSAPKLEFLRHEAQWRIILALSGDFFGLWVSTTGRGLIMDVGFISRVGAQILSLAGSDDD